jgi:hypothetical protein
MFDGNDSDERRGTEEVYAGAISTGSTRVGNDHTIRTPGDVIAAAGMNKHRMGLALARLASEWNSGATPKPKPDPDVKALARQTAERRWARAPFVFLPIVHAEDVKAAEREAERQIKEAGAWQEQEHGLRLQRLKTLPLVRAGLLAYVTSRGWEGGEHLVAAVIQRFLSPVCSACEGRGLRVIPGTNRTGKKACGECKGSGETKVPHGGCGRALLNHMKACTATAARDLREGAYRLRRSGANEASRLVDGPRDALQMEMGKDGAEKHAQDERYKRRLATQQRKT